MSSLSPKDRVSLCTFTFSDGRHCRTPRVRNHPHFCFYHAQKEARARAAQKLGKDLAYFFSGNYLSACDLSTALACLIPAVVSGDVKSKTAHTVAYLAQTLMQAIHISQGEYINAFGTDGWRKSIRNSVNDNYNYRFPPVPEPAPSAFRETLRNEQPQSPQPQPAQPPTQSPQSEIPALSGPVPSTHTPLPPTSGEFVQHVLAGLPQLSPSDLVGQTGVGEPPLPAEIRVSCHPGPTDERPTRCASPESSREEPASSVSPVCHPERSEGSHPIPSATSAPPTSQPANPSPTLSPSPKPVLPLDSRALHYDHTSRLRIDGKPF